MLKNVPSALRVYSLFIHLTGFSNSLLMNGNRLRQNQDGRRGCVRHAMIQFQSDVAVLPKNTLAEWQRLETPKILQTVAATDQYSESRNHLLS